MAIAKKKAAAKKKAPGKSVAKAKSNALSTAIDFSADVGAGLQNVDQDSLAIPFLTVLHFQSPQVIKGNADYVEGAESGMFFNSVTKELFDGESGVRFIQCDYTRRFVQWGSRNSGGGYKGDYSVDEAADMEQAGTVVKHEMKLMYPINDTGEISDKKSDVLVDTRNHLGLMYSEASEEWQPCWMPMKSTNIKHSKALVTALNNIKRQDASGKKVTPPTFLTECLLTSAPESNDEGDWFSIRPALVGDVESAELYHQGKSFYESMQKGEAKVNYAAEEATQG